MPKIERSSHDKTLRTNKLIYSVYRKLASAALKGKVNIKYINCNLVAECEEPFVIIASHASSMDMQYVALACGQPLHFVVPEYHMHTKPFGKVLSSMGAIAKHVNQPYSQVLDDITTASAGGGNIALFASDMPNITPDRTIYASGLGKLIQQIGRKVFVLKISGAYSVMPPYATQLHKGVVTVEAIPLLSPAELARCLPENIDMMLQVVLAHDEGAYMANHSHMQPSKEGFAHNMHHILYCCPNCGSESGVNSSNTEIFCTTCGARAKVGGRLELNQVTGSDKFCVNTISEWWNAQLSIASKSISNGGSFVGDTVSLCQLDSKFSADPFVKVGEGIIWLDDSGLSFQGTKNGKPYKWHAPVESQPYLHSIAGYCVDCYYDGQYYRFVLDNKAHSAKWTCESIALHDVKIRNK